MSKTDKSGIGDLYVEKVGTCEREGSKSQLKLVTSFMDSPLYSTGRENDPRNCVVSSLKHRCFLSRCGQNRVDTIAAAHGLYYWCYV